MVKTVRLKEIDISFSFICPISVSIDDLVSFLLVLLVLGKYTRWNVELRHSPGFGVFFFFCRYDILDL